MSDSFADPLTGIASAVGGPLVAGGLSLLGGLFQQQGQNDSIKRQEDYQTQMSNTAYTRAVADMKNAGLNPALMYGSGGPESTPGGASMMPPNVLQGAVDSTMAQISGNADFRLKTAQALSTYAQLPKYQAESDFFASLTPVIKGLAPFLQTSAGGLSTLNKAINQGITSAAEIGGDFASDVSEWWSTAPSANWDGTNNRKPDWLWNFENWLDKKF